MNALRIIAGSLILGLFFAANVSAQVRVTVPGKSFVVSERITATVENESGETVTICVMSGQISKSGPTAVSTPVPFSIEAREFGKWKVLMVSPEGAASEAVVLEPRKPREYPFWPPTKGELRLQMHYWQGPHPSLDCAHPPADSHNAKDTTFAVHAAPK